jgi:uncharacterized protein DUF2336
MNTHVSLMTELQQALDRGSDGARERILSRVTALFLSASHYDDEQIRIYDEILLRLVERIEEAALVQLSEHLAPIEHPPPNVIRTLAMNDAIDVAGPILLRSPGLSDEQLIAIAQAKSQAHLLAISGRGRLSEPLTDVLVSKGDGKVAQQVVSNPGARFSQAGFEVLAKRAENDEELAAGIVGRPDVPLRVFCSLLASATEIVQQRLLAATHQENHARVQEVVVRVSGAIADEVPPPPNYAEALRSVLSQHGSGNLTEEDVMYFACRRELAETVAALSVVWSLPIEVTEHLVCRMPVDTLLLCSKGAGFAWSTVRAIAQVRPAAPSPQRLIELRNRFASLSESDGRVALIKWQRGEPRTSPIEPNLRALG